MNDVGLLVTQRVAASAETVFDAFLRPDRLSLWLAPGDDWTTEVHHVDARVGGTYALTMIAPDGEKHPIVGTYRVLRRPHELEFTWRWDRPGSPETVVRVRLHENARQTEIVLTHERFPDEPTKQKHVEGWDGCLARLAALVQRA